MARKSQAQTAQPHEQPQAEPSFNLEEMAAIVKQLRDELNALKAKPRADTHSRVAQAFIKAGYKDVVLYDNSKTLAEQPNCTVLTFDKWFELGRRVIEGEKSLKIKNFGPRLFHKSQTRLASVEERKAQFARKQERAAKREAEKASA